MKRLLISVALIFGAQTAWADIPPPEDYEETCVLSAYTGDGAECRECSVTHEDFEACSKQLSPEGFTKKCQTFGASAYTEIWCKGEGNSNHPANNGGDSDTDKGDGCTAGTLSWLAFLGAPLLFRRRRA